LESTIFPLSIVHRYKTFLYDCENLVAFSKICERFTIACFFTLHSKSIPAYLIRSLHLSYIRLSGMEGDITLDGACHAFSFRLFIENEHEQSTPTALVIRAFDPNWGRMDLGIALRSMRSMYRSRSATSESRFTICSNGIIHVLSIAFSACL
jgi:hypothetical protein